MNLTKALACNDWTAASKIVQERRDKHLSFCKRVEELIGEGRIYGSIGRTKKSLFWALTFIPENGSVVTADVPFESDAYSDSVCQKVAEKLRELLPSSA